jgi:hypothetical protein
MPGERIYSAAKSNLPIASVIDDPETFKRAVALLRKATANKVKKSEIEESDEQVRAELAAICEAYSLKGLKHGLAGFEYHGYATRKTLSKELLLARGVSAEDIEASYKEGDPFLSAKVVVFDIE